MNHYHHRSWTSRRLTGFEEIVALLIGGMVVTALFKAIIFLIDVVLASLLYGIVWICQKIVSYFVGPKRIDQERR